MGDQALADMFDGGVSSVLSSFDATASQPAQNGAGTGTVNVGGLSPELVPAQMVSENVNLSGARYACPIWAPATRIDSSRTRKWGVTEKVAQPVRKLHTTAGTCTTRHGLC